MTKHQSTPCHPCPKCGGEVHMRDDYSQHCTVCAWVWLPPSKRPLLAWRRAIAIRFDVP